MEHSEPRARVLIVDDEPDIRELLEITLARMNLDTCAAETLGRAHALLEAEPFDLCLTDMRLPDGNGIDLVRHIQRHHPALPVAVITAHGSMETAISALKAGAFDFVSKPVELEDLRNIVRSALRTNAGGGVRSEPATERLLGRSAAMQRVRELITKLAHSQAPVFIHGESGTGKELAARLIHELGPRAEKPFVPVNCGAIPENLMESEFFGHKKGSFTGAVQDKDGLFVAADGGTLFLDEVGDLPIPMQVKLLRAIQERCIRPVGSENERRVDVRILSATHRDLRELVREGRFRQDLYYRLDVIELVIPPLRQRPEDIPLLAEQISARISSQPANRPPRLTVGAIRALERYGFPGNVRELENVLERAVTLCDGREITEDDLQLPQPEPHAGEATGDEDDGLPLEAYLARVEERTIRDALKRTGNNKTAAAKLLGVSFRALRYKLDKLGID